MFMKAMKMRNLSQDSVFCIKMFKIGSFSGWDAWLAPSVKLSIPDLRGMSSSPILDAEILDAEIT